MEAKDRPAPQLGVGALSEFDYASHRWDARIGIGVSPEDLLVPGFWAHHAMRLSPMDEIRAHAEDGSWVAYLLVLDCSRNWAKVKLLSAHQLTTADVSLTAASDAEVKAVIEAHEILHRGPRRWSVVRRSDRAVLHEDELQKEAALAWLNAYARAQIGAPKAAAVASLTG